MTTEAPARRPGARDRIVAAAERLFHVEGIRAVGVDRLCAEAGVSKRSLYQHFAGKDDVVVAMLRARGAAIGARFPGPESPPRDRILAVFEQVHADALVAPVGCPFVGAAVELKDAAHPAVGVAREHKSALTAWFAAQLDDAGVAASATLAEQLTLVFDGASAHTVMYGAPSPATRTAVETLLAAHGL